MQWQQKNSDIMLKNLEEKGSFVAFKKQDSHLKDI